MKKSLIFTLFFILLSIGIKSQISKYFWMGIGPTYNGLVGKGTAGDRFNHNLGVTLELGFNHRNNWQWLIYGFSSFTNKNKIYDDYAKASFIIPYYTEIRKSFLKKNCMIFLGFGIGSNRMKFIDIQGHDYQFMYALGTGIQLLARKSKFMQFTFRPYGVTGNQLGYKYGTEFSLILGGWFVE